MREILFRGKRLDNGEWVEGAYCPKSCDSPFGPMLDKPSIIKLDDPFSGFWFDVDPSTVGQFTGLTANGKKIFEGDIIKRVAAPMVVVWNKDDASFIAQYSTEELNLTNTLFGSWRLEVIGNIHDNQELLEDVGR